MCLAFSSLAHAEVVQELVLSDGADSATIDISDTNLVSVTCNAGACGQITQGNVGLRIFSDGAHGTISIVHALFGAGNNFTISLTGAGGDDATRPTLMNFNQINTESQSGGGILTAIFTDSDYTDLSPILNVADSNVSDVAIQSSTIVYSVFTDSGDGIPAGTQVYTNSLTGHSSSNGIDGVNAVNPNSPNASLTTEAVLTFAGNGTIQANISISNVIVPEPGSTVLLGLALSGLAGFVLLGRFRTNRRVQ